MAIDHPLAASLRELSKGMAEALRSSASFGHNLTKGEVREQHLAEKLRPFIPTRFDMASGEATNVAGDVSLQQDVMIYDAARRAPFVRVGHHAILPIEGVFASIQVKTSVSPSSIGGCVENLQSLKKIAPNTLDRAGGHPGGIVVSEFPVKPLTAIVAYEASGDADELQEAFFLGNEKVPDPTDRVDALVVPGRFSMVLASMNGEKVSLGTPSAVATHLHRLDASDDAFLVFYAILSEWLATYVPPVGGLIEYAEAMGARDHESTTLTRV